MSAHTQGPWTVVDRRGGLQVCEIRGPHDEDLAYVNMRALLAAIQKAEGR